MSPILEELRKKNDYLYKKSNVGAVKLLLESMRLSPSSNTKVQLVRSLAVSGLSFVVDFTILILLKEGANFHYLIAATIGYCTGLFVNYFLSVQWVFADRKLTNRKAEFTIFVIISLVGLVINNLVLAGIVQYLTADYRIAKLVATIVVFFWNFLARKRVLY